MSRTGISGSMIAAEIKELRQSLRLTQADLASAVHVDRTAVSHWERGKHAPSATASVRLSALRGDELRLVPLHLREATAFVKEHHRHHLPPLRAKFVVGAAIGGRLVGVAIVGRPVSRGLDDRLTLEVTRVATDGTRNVNSLLYGAAWRAARALGYRRLVTYTLPSESGASLRAVGWKLIGQTRGGSWSCPSRPRQDKHPTVPKLRWQVEARDAA